MSFEAWQRLREDQNLDVAKARRVLRAMIETMPVEQDRNTFAPPVAQACSRLRFLPELRRFRPSARHRSAGARALHRRARPAFARPPPAASLGAGCSKCSFARHRCGRVPDHRSDRHRGCRQPTVPAVRRSARRQAAHVARRRRRRRARRERPRPARPARCVNPSCRTCGTNAAMSSSRMRIDRRGRQPVADRDREIATHRRATSDSRCGRSCAQPAARRPAAADRPVARPLRCRRRRLRGSAPRAPRPALSRSTRACTASRASACARSKASTSRVGSDAPDRPRPMRAIVRSARKNHGSCGGELMARSPACDASAISG